MGAAYRGGMAEQHSKERGHAAKRATRQLGYERRWCKKCGRRTFHWVDDSDAFTRRQCDDCGRRSGVQIMFWIKRFAVPVAIGLTLVLVSLEPTRRLLHL